MSAATWAGIGLLGGVGALVRHGAELRLGAWGQRLVNVAGAFVLGLLAGTAAPVVTVGFLGAMTTFSGWMLRARERPALELGGQLAAGVAAVWLGSRL